MSKVEEILQVKLRGHEDLFYFNKYVLGFNLLDDVIHLDLCNFVVNTPGDLLIIEPRDCFKTTCVSIGYAIWLLVNDPTRKILINRKILKKSVEVLRAIKGQMENNNRLRYLYGDMVGPVWTQSEIIVRKAKVDKDPSIAIGSVDHPNTGSHYTDIINDDIWEESDRYSEAARAETSRFYTALGYVKDKGRNPREINIGTRWHMNDLAATLLNSKYMTKRVHKIINDDGSLYFPSRWPQAKIDEERERGDGGPELFETMMMQNPIMDADRTFKLDELHLYDHGSIDYDAGTTFSFVDPALSDKGDACFTAQATGTLIEGKLYLRTWNLWKVVADVGQNNILDSCEADSVMELKIESNQAFVLYVDGIRKKAAERGLSMAITDAPATKDKIGRIRAAANYVKQNTYFRRDWQTAYPRAITQLLEFPQSKAKDAPDALEGLVSMVAGGSSEPRIRRL